MADLEAQLVTALDCSVIETEVNDIVIAVAAFDRDLLGVEQFIVMPYLDSDAIRPVGIRIFLSPLDVCSFDVDSSVFTRQPLIDRIKGGTCMYHILLHDKAFGSSGFITQTVLSLLCQNFRTGRLCSFEEPPAVCTLFNGGQSTEICKVVVVSDFDCRYFVCIFNYESVITTVISRVCTRINDHGNCITLVYTYAVDGEVFCNFPVG